MKKIVENLVKALAPLSFEPPTAFVYNPLEYAGAGFMQYFEKFGGSPKEILLVGMNPGPWGMAQTGVPFGEISFVTEWMGINAEIGSPGVFHPKKPVDGLACTKSEVSGKRLWGWARDRFKTPEDFFSRFFVANYCPLMFLDAEGRNRTPDKLKKKEKTPLFDACDRALKSTVDYFQPEFVIGVGRFAEMRAKAVLKDTSFKTGGITHPSPANPKANKGWSSIIEAELRDLGVKI